MKHVTLTVILLFSVLANYAQQLSPADREEYDQLRRKAKSSKITGIVMVASGGGFLIGGAYMLLVGSILNTADEEWYYDENGNYTSRTKESGKDVKTIGAIAAGVGAGLALTSIYFFKRGGNFSEQARKIKTRVRSNSINIPINGTRSMKIPQLQLSVSIPLGS